MITGMPRIAIASSCLLLALSQNMRAIVSQRLIPTLDGKRCAAVEVLLGTKTIRDMILNARLEDIKEIMEKSDNLGMQTFDSALFNLVANGRIKSEDDSLEGLVLFVGGTGSGKSTSLAALIDYRNTNSAGHIITIEDPVEYVHRHKKSLINQREVGVDTRSFKKVSSKT